MTTTILPSTAISTAESATAPAQRLFMFDVVRFVAAMGIIWIHTPQTTGLQLTTGIGRFAVPFFTLGAVFFLIEGVRRHPERHFGTYAASRFTRIYVPFLVWTVIYLFLRNAKHSAVTARPNVPIQPSLLWVGSTEHLWFLPFILAVCLIMFPVARWLASRPNFYIFATVCAVAGFILAIWPRPRFMASQGATNWQQTCYFLSLSWNAFPSIFFAVPFAYAFHRWQDCGLRRAGATWIGLAVCVLCTAGVCFFGRSNLLENLAGVGAAVFGLSTWEGRWIRHLASLGILAYGIYLSHLVFVHGLQAAAILFHIHPAWWSDIGIFLSAAIGSTLLIYILSRKHWTWWVTG